MTDGTTTVWIRPGSLVSVTPLGGIPGRVTEVAVTKRTIVVDLEVAGAWTGSVDEVTVIVPPDTRHPAVQAMAGAVEHLGALAFLDVDSANAKRTLAVLRWTADHVDDRDGLTSASSWLDEQADQVEASVTT